MEPRLRKGELTLREKPPLCDEASSLRNSTAPNQHQRSNSGANKRQGGHPGNRSDQRWSAGCGQRGGRSGCTSSCASRGRSTSACGRTSSGTSACSRTSSGTSACRGAGVHASAIVFPVVLRKSRRGEQQYQRCAHDKHKQDLLHEVPPLVEADALSIGNHLPFLLRHCEPFIQPQSTCAYSPECVEVEFCELRLDGVLGSSALPLCSRAHTLLSHRRMLHSLCG